MPPVPRRETILNWVETGACVESRSMRVYPLSYRGASGSGLPCVVRLHGVANLRRPIQAFLRGAGLANPLAPLGGLWPHGERLRGRIWSGKARNAKRSIIVDVMQCVPQPA